MVRTEREIQGVNDNPANTAAEHYRELLSQSRQMLAFQSHDKDPKRDYEAKIDER